MSDIAIKCEGLSKRYRIGEQERYKALRDVIADTATAPFRRLRHAISGNGNAANGDGSEIRNSQSAIRNSHIWALDDVSFEVMRGEVVGIIGRNGAGKSTLLKILSRITKPTKGYAEIHGRVGSLLEVGTGFHPELTGRENIYLNGAILGMHRAEINRKFDEIVAFAEVEKFIDTPVKRYSSGMHVRLAFAVAAHMETEILLVDEVLAVGDAEFQKKCLGKIGDVAKHGRTVLFVSHNLASVQSLSERCVLLDSGTIVADGPSATVIQSYAYQDTKRLAHVDLRNHPNRQFGCTPFFISIGVLNSDGQQTSVVFAGHDLILRFEIDPAFSVALPVVGVGIDNALGLRVFSVTNEFTLGSWQVLDKPIIVQCTIPHISLMPGRYAMNISLRGAHGGHIDAISSAAFFDVEVDDYFGSGRVPTSDLGVVLVKSTWRFGQWSESAS